MDRIIRVELARRPDKSGLPRRNLHEEIPDPREMPTFAEMADRALAEDESRDTKSYRFRRSELSEGGSLRGYFGAMLINQITPRHIHERQAQLQAQLYAAESARASTASPNWSSFTPMRFMIERYKLHSLRLSSPLSV